MGEAPAQPLRLALHAMGTRFELVLVADGSRSAAELRAIGELALAAITECETRFSAFRRDSERSRVLRELEHGAVRLGADFAALLVLAREMWRASERAFDPCLGSGFEHLEWNSEQRSVRAAVVPTTLDFGAIAKGWAVDHAAALLREEGIERALLHGGTSSVLAIGAPPGQSAWGVALRDPRRGAKAPAVARVELCDLALSVSAPHGRLDLAGQGHVLDPAGGDSVDVPLAAVMHPSAAIADAWSTALLVRIARSWQGQLATDSIAAPSPPWPSEEPTCFWLTRDGASHVLRGPRSALLQVSHSTSLPESGPS